MKKIYLTCFLIILINIFLLTSDILKDILSTERVVNITNQNSKIILDIKKDFKIDNNIYISKIIYTDNYKEGFDLIIYDNNENIIKVPIRKTNPEMDKIESYFTNTKKKYNKFKLLAIIILAIIELYFIYKFFSLKKNTK